MGMSYDDIKIAPAYAFVGVIIIILTFSDTMGFRDEGDEWILSQFDAHWWRQYLLVGWKTAVFFAYGMVITMLIYYKLDGPWKSPLKVDEEGHPSCQSARQKTFKKNLMTACLLALCFFATVLFVTFFAMWDGFTVFD